uniref:Uncharacterized protein n=1 Tax=Talaromyces marneffei PM1 TaxID=1077442 RepID=A0A093URB6_TALMA
MDTPISSPGSHPSLISILTSRLQILSNEILSINETVRCGKLQLNQEEYRALEGASEDLGKRAEGIIEVVHALGKRRANAANGQKLVLTMEHVRSDLVTSRKLKHRATFIRNIQLIFEGPKESGLDSVPVKARKRLTHERCEQIRGLGTNRLILWSAAFPPSQWDPNLLPKATFESWEWCASCSNSHSIWNRKPSYSDKPGTECSSATWYDQICITADPLLIDI